MKRMQSINLSKIICKAFYKYLFLKPNQIILPFQIFKDYFRLRLNKFHITEHILFCNINLSDLPSLFINILKNIFVNQLQMLKIKFTNNRSVKKLR